MAPMAPRDRRLPNTPFRTAPTSGSSGISQRKFTIGLPFQQIAPVHVQGLAIPEHRNNQCKPDGCFRCRNNQYKEDKYLPADLAVAAGKGDKRQVDGIQHDFHRQQQRDDVSLQEESQHSQKEQGCAEDEIPVEWNHKSFFAKTTAPISAISIKSDVSSKGRR